VNLNGFPLGGFSSSRLVSGRPAALGSRCKTVDPTFASPHPRRPTRIEVHSEFLSYYGFCEGRAIAWSPALPVPWPQEQLSSDVFNSRRIPGHPSVLPGTADPALFRARKQLGEIGPKAFSAQVYRVGAGRWVFNYLSSANFPDRDKLGLLSKFWHRSATTLAPAAGKSE